MGRRERNFITPNIFHEKAKPGDEAITRAENMN